VSVGDSEGDISMFARTGWSVACLPASDRAAAAAKQVHASGSILDLVRTDVDEDMLALALTPVPEAGDLDVLFGAPDLRCADERLLTPTLWRRVVAGLRRTHDYVIVDTPGRRGGRPRTV
jgi:hypothetical protein